ncbi:hypothetical protein ASD97_09970 [Streptomyces sp. Root63]|uniref:hypothetical protein n=1 Tax=unclassified Streptomyces TaxID=2593676 RepID=UPI0006FD4505|nr:MULTISPECIES: hypothetical protein [unclassified Streptomyces]KQX37012.1 hypothetical protein ASD29_07260 [Streptomyces sp. Root1295]KRA43927.1 hypothetical protein ASD97_09970 [Streptomyces sp. Root63]
MKIAVIIAAASSLAIAPLASALVDSPKPSRSITTTEPSRFVLDSTAARLPKLPTKACKDDDSNSVNCYWDAAKRGNGKGHSYYVTAKGQVVYLNPKLNNEAARTKFARAKKAAGWDYWGEVGGHRLCWAKVGDTSYIQCFDGFRETS